MEIDYCRVRIVVEHNTIYLSCYTEPCVPDNFREVGVALNLVNDDEIYTSKEAWRIDYIDWSKVSLIAHQWVAAGDYDT